MPDDSLEVAKCKRDRGFCVDGWISPLVVDTLADRYGHKHGIDGKRFLLSSIAGFEHLLVLVANQHTVLKEMGLKDKEIRLSLLRGSQAIISHHILFAGSSELGVPVQDGSGGIIKSDEVPVTRRREVVALLQRFQQQLLQRVSPPTRDIRNR